MRQIRGLSGENAKQAEEELCQTQSSVSMGNFVWLNRKRKIVILSIDYQKE